MSIYNRPNQYLATEPWVLDMIRKRYNSTGATGATGVPGSATNTGATGSTGSTGATGWTGAEVFFPIMDHFIVTLINLIWVLERDRVILLRSTIQTYQGTYRLF
jgi:hypothetical protein